MRQPSSPRSFLQGGGRQLTVARSAHPQSVHSDFVRTLIVPGLSHDVGVLLLHDGVVVLTGLYPYAHPAEAVQRTLRAMRGERAGIHRRGGFASATHRKAGFSSRLNSCAWRSAK